MGVESEARLLLSLIETILEDEQRGAVDKVEQIHDMLTSPAAAWLAGKTQSEVFIEKPFYVLFVYRSGKDGGYSHEAGSSDLATIAAQARREIKGGARTAYVTQIIEVVSEPT